MARPVARRGVSMLWSDSRRGQLLRLAIVALVMLEAGLGVREMRHSVFPFTHIRSIAAPADARQFGWQADMAPDDARPVRAALGASVASLPHGMAQIIGVRERLREIVPHVTRDEVSSRDPHEILAEVMAGKQVICGDLAVLEAFALRSLGYQARILMLTTNLVRGDLDTHQSVEVWNDSLRKWIVMDPTFNSFYVRTDGVPLGAVEIHDLLRVGRRGEIREVRGRGDRHPTSEEYYVDPLITYRNVFIWNNGAVTLPGRVLFRDELGAVDAEQQRTLLPILINFVLPGTLVALVVAAAAERREQAALLRARRRAIDDEVAALSRPSGPPRSRTTPTAARAADATRPAPS